LSSPSAAVANVVAVPSAVTRTTAFGGFSATMRSLCRSGTRRRAAPRRDEDPPTRFPFLLAIAAGSRSSIDYALTHVREVRAARAFATGAAQASKISAEDLGVLRTAMRQIERAIQRLAELSGDDYPPPWLRTRMER
jgi:hypothetical protein